MTFDLNISQHGFSRSSSYAKVTDQSSCLQDTKAVYRLTNETKLGKPLGQWF